MTKVRERYSEQREILFRIIKSAPGPMTVNDIYKTANKENQSTGLATVYRTIKFLLKNDKIKAVHLADGHPRYTIPTLEHLHYFLCRLCKVVLAVNHCCVHLHKDEMAGHLIKDHEITLTGVCKDCRKIKQNA